MLSSVHRDQTLESKTQIEKQRRVLLGQYEQTGDINLNINEINNIGLDKKSIYCRYPNN